MDSCIDLVGTVTFVEIFKNKFNITKVIKYYTYYVTPF